MEEKLTRKIKYECDYCGGYEMDVDADSKEHTEAAKVIGLFMSMNQVLDMPEMKLKVCVWCWKKSFDKALKPSVFRKVIDWTVVIIIAQNLILIAEKIYTKLSN